MTPQPHKRSILIVRGLQRSGNHAVLNWVRSLFPSFAFHNDQPHDLFRDDQAVQALLDETPARCTVFSFEDSEQPGSSPDQLLADTLVPFPGSLAKDYEVHHLIILRDPYNTWASRVAAYDRLKVGGWKLSSALSWPQFRNNWMDLAREAENDPDCVILYNRWCLDAAYRRHICDELGGTYNEATLEKVATNGSGSSFQGVPRPSYRQMLFNIRKYASKKFLKRLLLRPKYYIDRFISPPHTASSMTTDKRWPYLLKHEEGADIFTDEALFETTNRVFGDLAPLTQAERQSARKVVQSSRAASTASPCPLS